MLAVLPFRSRGGDEDYFAEGMCDEMIAQLGRLAPDKLGVIAHTSTIRFKDTILPADQIGRELGVGFLLEGSVRRSAPRVRITARLVRVADQSQLWVENFDETIEDVLAIQIECAKRIARSLALELVPAHRDAMGRAATSNAPAYESYLRGRYFWNRRTADAFDKAVASFEDSIARAPDFALARVGLADVWNLAGLYSVAPPGIAGSKARLALDRALAIDDASAEAHVSLALNRFLYEWDWPGAEDAFRYGLDQNPNLAQGHYLYAFFLATMGRFDEAFRHADEARALDPVSLVISTHSGWVCYFARDYDRAIGAFGKAIEMDPTFAPASLFLGLAYLQKGDWGAAVETLRRAREWSGSHPGATSGLAIALTLDGREGEAQELFDSAESGARDAYVSPYYRALAALGMGRTEAALDLLESAFDERSPWLVCLAVEPAIDPLRSDPRCRKLLEGVGLTRAAGS
jgi:TolB-like protein/Tfp pilus assembly protein PilF